MRILFILPVLADAYYRKRVEELLNCGISATIIGFERPYYQGNRWAQRTVSLGFIRHGRYVSRIGILIRSIRRIRFHAKSQSVVYCFNLDMLFLGWVATIFRNRRIQLVYEVADIKSVLIGRGIVGSVLRWIERQLLARTDLLVVTSPAYFDEYFNGIQGMKHTQYLVIENKLTERQESPDRAKVSHVENVPPGKIRIGYFGLIRCRKSWWALREVAKRGNGHVEIYIRGIVLGMEHLEDEAKVTPHVVFGGAYVNPDELREMYSKVDLVWVAHAHGETNTKWSRSNRFYEACYFARPMIAQIGTQDARAVMEYGIGTIVDLSDPVEAADRVLEITCQEIVAWRDNFGCIPRNVFMYEDEHARLVEILRSRMDDGDRA